MIGAPSTRLLTYPARTQSASRPRSIFSTSFRSILSSQVRDPASAKEKTPITTSIPLYSSSLMCAKSPLPMLHSCSGAVVAAELPHQGFPKSRQKLRARRVQSAAPRLFGEPWVPGCNQHGYPQMDSTPWCNSGEARVCRALSHFISQSCSLFSANDSMSRVCTIQKSISSGRLCDRSPCHNHRHPPQPL